MRFSDIIERHIYNVDFEPHKESEFDRTHLAIVLKKNNDNRTCIVAPLTSDNNGDGINKYNLGKLTCLPTNMQSEDSYIVFNQVRTVNHGRFIALKNDAREKINCKIDDVLFKKVTALCINELTSSMNIDEKIECYLEKYIENACNLLVDTAYNVKRELQSVDNDILLTSLQNRINSILQINFDYEKYISETDKNNDICNIIDTCLKHNILKEYKRLLLENDGQAK